MRDEDKLLAIRAQWQQYRAYLEAKYPAPPGVPWAFTCPEHIAIDALLSENA